MINKNMIKLSFVLVLAIASLMGFFGTSYAYFVYDKVSTKEHTIQMGEIDLTYSGETTAIAANNMFPMKPEKARLRNDNTVSFNLSGINTSEDTIYYAISLRYADPVTGKNRIDDKFLSFDLEETENGITKKVVKAASYNDIQNTNIYVNTIDSETGTTINRTYRLRMWVNEDIKVSDSDQNADYTTSEFANLYASFDINVYGDLEEKTYTKVLNTTTDKLIDQALPSTGPSEFVTNANGINYGNISSDTNGKGLYILPGTESDEYPIAFFRGAVTNNNVIFGGFCWQIVRTTDTGGIKMIYNGAATGNGTTCENTAHADKIISTSRFNTNSTSMSDVGYMYNTRYEYSTSGWTTDALFASSATWVTDHYELTDASVTTPNATHHYSCNATSSSATCTNLRYVYYVIGTTKYYITLTDGELIEDALYKMTGNGTSEVITRNSGYVLNTTNSTIKTNLETWFSNNLNDYIDYLEDTTWCNDRTFKSSGSNIFASSGWNPSGGSLSQNIYFGTMNRFSNSSWYSTSNVPVTTCAKESDSFRVNNSQAPLTYPIGLLTADEVIMGGASGNSNTSNSTYYLYSSGNYWLGASYIFISNDAAAFTVGLSGYLSNNSVNGNVGLRAAVSLKLGTEFEDGGDGSPTNPYVVKMN